MVENIEEYNKTFCRKCHRELKDEQSKKLGFGPICYKKFMNRKKTYLFEMEDNKLKLKKEDISTFYILKSHYDITSTNIGVIDNIDNFKKRMKVLCKHWKEEKPDIYIRNNGRKYTILFGNIERTYILLETIEDLTGLYFRQFI